MEQLEFDMPKAKSSIIKVIGVGGAGSNAVNHMFQKGIKGVNYIVANTDEQHLNLSPVPTKILLGAELTKGHGTGADPEIGRLATEESVEKLRAELGHGTRMLFIAAGMGKGTGTGGSPVIAKLAREMGILTVAIVTTPFTMLGKRPVEKAEEGIEKLKENVDALIIISNDKIKQIYGNLKGNEAFALADDILKNATKGIAEIITGAGVHNTDFNDVYNVLVDGGMTIMGIGEAKGENRAAEATNNALNSPLLDNIDIRGAKKALVNISFSESSECTLDEIGDIINMVNESAQDDIEIIYGTSIDNTLEDELSVTIVITGFNTEKYVNPILTKVDAIEKIEKYEEEKLELELEITNVEIEADIIALNPVTLVEVPILEKQHFETIFDAHTELQSSEIEIKFQEETETSFYDGTGRNFEETDEAKRERLLTNLSYDTNTPLNSPNNATVILEPLTMKSNQLITANNPNLFKDNNLFNMKLD